MNKPQTFYSIWEDGYYTGTMTALLCGYDMSPVYTPTEADVIVFNGGQDIATEIYNEKPIYRGIPQLKTRRDLEEIKLYDQFVGDKFLLGICRGAQLLNCLNGGTLWQHVRDHGRDHKMVDLTSGEVMNVTSTHHQMMKPDPILGTVIGVSNICTSRESEKDRDQSQQSHDIKGGKDIEVVWYPNTRSLCIQGHPEYVPGSRFADWSFELLTKKYMEQLVCAA